MKWPACRDCADCRRDAPGHPSGWGYCHEWGKAVPESRETCRHFRRRCERWLDAEGKGEPGE